MDSFDLLEEIARLEGFDAIPEVVPSRPLQIVSRQPSGPDQEGVRNALVGLGLSETIHFSFIDPSWVEDLGLAEDHPWRAQQVKVANPLSEVGGVLRPTLLPSLLRAVARNRAMGAEDVRFFELRRVFQMREDGFDSVLSGDGRPTDRTPVIERRSVCGILVGRRNAPGWSATDTPVDFFDIRACADVVCTTLGAKGWNWSPEELPGFLDPRESAVLSGAGGRGSAGWAGRIAVPVLRAFSLDVVVWAFELDLDRLAPKRRAVPKFQPFSRFPGVARDLAFVVPDSVPAERLLDTGIRAARKGMKDAFLKAEIFDVYRGEGMPAGCRSVAFRFAFRASDRTLEDRAVDGVMTQIEKQITQTEGVVLRS